MRYLTGFFQGNAVGAMIGLAVALHDPNYWLVAAAWTVIAALTGCLSRRYRR
jgi:hypothetical protein